MTALKDVQDALIALRSDRERSASLQLAANAALLARQRYDTGLVDFQTVLETQRTRLGHPRQPSQRQCRCQRRPCAALQGAGWGLGTGHHRQRITTQ